MLLIESRYFGDDGPSEKLILPFESRTKSRLRAHLESGEEIGLFLERGSVLRGGDRLQGKDGRIVEVVAAQENLMEARLPDAHALARAAFHLGNRHVPVEIGAGWLHFEADHVLRDMLIGLGAEVSEIRAPFEPEAGAYAPGHQHPGETSSGAKIHQYHR